MNHTFTDKVVKTRKEHNCYGCTEIIEKEQKARNIKSVYDGGFCNDYFCMECDEFMKDVCMSCRVCWENETFFFGTIKECKQEQGYNDKEE